MNHSHHHSILLCIIYILCSSVPLLAASGSSSKFFPDEDTQAVVPLHLHHGTLHVYLYVGSPPQRQILIIDTGSKYMSFPCEPFCNKIKCGSHVSEKFYDLRISTTRKIRKTGTCFGMKGFDPEHVNNMIRKPKNRQQQQQQQQQQNQDSPHEKRPRTAERNQITVTQNSNPRYCNMKQMYLEGSFWDGYEVEDIVWLGTKDYKESQEIVVPLGAPYTFGCQRTAQGTFMKQYADGIMGMTRHSTNFIRVLAKSHHVLKRNAFSICVTSDNQGSMALGGSLPIDLYHIEPMKFTKTLKADGLWNVEVEAVFVGTACITCDKKAGPKLLNSMNVDQGTILDSGTTDSYLSSSIEKPLVKEWIKCTGQSQNNNSFKERERNYTFAEFLDMCTITVVFHGNVSLTIEPANFMEGAIEVKEDETNTTSHSVGFPVPWDGTRKLSNRLYLDEPAGSVLGVNAMVGYDILYDDQGGQIGIARANCPTNDD